MTDLNRFVRSYIWLPCLPSFILGAYRIFRWCGGRCVNKRRRKLYRVFKQASCLESDW
jgi:hypothetical protein